MAIDTAKKRASALGVGQVGTVPLPDGQIDAGDRAQLAGAYRGFADAGAGSYPDVVSHRSVSVYSWRQAVAVR